jgi:hypothetical protein
VITDGNQTTDKGSYTPLDQASQPLKDKGVFVYALGIGKGVDIKQLRPIATNSRGVFTAASFEDLKPTIRVIIDSVCRDGKYGSLSLVNMELLHFTLS